MSPEDDARHGGGPDQKTTGLYRLITLPRFYRGFMDLLGADAARRRYVEEWFGLTGDEAILDLGCGPGTLVPYLRYSRYLGVDLNPGHIATATARFGDARTRFRAGAAQAVVGEDLGAGFDRILCVGFLHHIDDADVRQVLSALAPKLAPGGWIALLEPVFLKPQNPIARGMKRIDSGQHVRWEDEWRALFDGYEAETRITHDLLRLPYDHLWVKLRPA